ncbi:MAG: glycosyl hydrolase [Negativicutes bacterium]|nr:glycosyl hydrolase [Negativicutes bacterium]
MNKNMKAWRSALPRIAGHDIWFLVDELFSKHPMRFLPALMLLLLCSAPVRAGDLREQFVNPPPSARPWVFWTWCNGNITKAGITADLEAMQRVGIGGVIIDDIGIAGHTGKYEMQFDPKWGSANFMNAEWQELFRFAVAEAHRVGVEINMENGPGWNGSSGTWITPELSMQWLVTTNLVVSGPVHFSAILPKPDTTGAKRRHDDYDSTVKYEDYYRDIAVLAIPETTNGIVKPDAVLNLTARLNTNGKLDWEVPSGKWIIQRIGYTTTGSSTRPPVAGGNGLECDKLSREAMDVHYANMMGNLSASVGSLAGPTLVATFIDSWEAGDQNWTPKLCEEFQKRRGYDPVPFLLDVIEPMAILGTAKPDANYGSTIGGPASAGRFRWDYQQTISELLVENYVGRLAALAHKHGLHLRLEGYELPFGDEAAYTERADEPMTEFWTINGKETEVKARQMASVAHVMGKPIVGAESFTSGDNDQWRLYPGTIKAIGDYEFSEGVNRFVFHRYAHQPFLDRFPGVTMGPYGLHYERTQTWWEMSGAWHEYLTRCQYLLRQGLFVADVCFLRPQLPNQKYLEPAPEVPAGYRYDECSAEALMARMRVKDGRLVLPDGMSYRLLVLPEKVTLMTPALVRKIKQLVADGATVLGPRPTASPSLSDYPICDQEVARTAAEVWGDCDGITVTEHPFGKGRVICGQPLAAVLKHLQIPTDFTASAKLNWMHRQVDETQIYFVANDRASPLETKCKFRVKGLRPELWNPETGETSPLAAYEDTDDSITVPLYFEASGSVFVVFRPQQKPYDPIVSFTRNNQPLPQLPVIAPQPETYGGMEADARFSNPQRSPVIKIQRATYGALGDPQHTRNVQPTMQTLADRGEVRFPVKNLAAGDEPAGDEAKALVVQYTIDGQSFKISGQDADVISLLSPIAAVHRAAEVRCDAAGGFKLVTFQPGSYELRTAAGKTFHAEIVSVPTPQEITGVWDAHFPPKWGAPEKIIMDHLASLSDSTNAGVKYFSGVITYTKMFDWNPAPQVGDQKPEIWLDLGEVQVMAQVKLNGHDLGVLWKPPFRSNVTGVLKPGVNMLEIRVADLWPNRMIGDAALPVAERFTWSSYEPFTSDTPLLKSGLIGPVTLQIAETTTLP